MNTHPKARLGLAGRHAMVCEIERGLKLRAAARTFNVSPATAHKWWHRWLEASDEGRRELSCLRDRSSKPHHSPEMLGAAEQHRICEVRRHTGWGPRLIAGVVGRPHSTVHATLHRNGISRPPRPKREQIVRYEWPCPGDLLHMDTKRYARFERPGHAVTADRSRTGRRRELGYEFICSRNSGDRSAWASASMKARMSARCSSSVASVVFHEAVTRSSGGASCSEKAAVASSSVHSSNSSSIAWLSSASREPKW